MSRIRHAPALDYVLSAVVFLQQIGLDANVHAVCAENVGGVRARFGAMIQDLFGRRTGTL